MTPDESQVIEELFHAALERVAGERRAYLEKACKDNADLLAEVEALVAAAEDEPDFLETSLSDTLTGNAGQDEREEPQISAESLVGRRVGAWRLIKMIAEGGMGAVYLASRADGQYEKDVAIKLLRRGVGVDDPVRRGKMIRRFKSELQHHANLDHPNVAKLLDGGTTDDGMPYIVMEHVEGSRIDEYCEKHDLPTGDRLRLFRAVCLAVQHAHSRFVAHCDIKPNNILVSLGHEPDPSPIPKLLDFGIARLLKQTGNNEPRATTATRIRPMTPEYASPEQVRNELITAASDVYSLGVVLYELITGKLPYDVTDYDAKQVICEEIPERPGAIREGIDREVGAIVLKALEKDPNDRYPSAGALADDIDRYLTGLPISAHSDNLTYRLRKFAHRHEARIASGVLIAALIAIGLAIGVLFGRAQREAEQQFAAAEWGKKLSQLAAVGRSLYNEAVAFEAAGEQTKAEKKYAYAEVCLGEVLEKERNSPPNIKPRDTWLIAETWRRRGRCLAKLRRYPEAEDLLLASHSVIRKHFGDAHPRALETQRWLDELRAERRRGQARQGGQYSDPP